MRFTVGNADPSDTYRWTWNGTVTATGVDFDIAAGTYSAGSYVVGVYGESGSCSSTLVTQTLIITDPSTLTINTGLTGNVVCDNETFTITVSDTQSSNTTYTFTYGGVGSPQTKNSSTGQVTFTLPSGLSSAGDNYISVVSTPSEGTT